MSRFPTSLVRSSTADLEDEGIPPLMFQCTAIEEDSQERSREIRSSSNEWLAQGPSRLASRPLQHFSIGPFLAIFLTQTPSPPPISRVPEYPISFQLIKVLQEATPTKQVRIGIYYTLNGQDANGRGFDVNSIWVMKIHKATPHSHPSHELDREISSYERLSEARHALDPEPGLKFIMASAAAILLRDCCMFLMPLAMTDLRAYLCYITPSQVHTMTAQIARGIQALHNIGIIHGDVKPENVLIDYNGCPRLTDFGSSYVLESMMPVGRDFIFSHYLSTPGYIAPEKLYNMHIGVMVDWWGLGCLFYEMVIAAHNRCDKWNVVLFEKLSLRDWVHCYSNDDARFAYLSLHGALPPDFSFDLLTGLLHPIPEGRFAMEDLVGHPYFIRENGESEFDNLDLSMHTNVQIPAEHLRIPSPRLSPVLSLTPQDEIFYL